MKSCDSVYMYLRHAPMSCDSVYMYLRCTPMSCDSVYMYLRHTQCHVILCTCTSDTPQCHVILCTCTSDTPQCHVIPSPHTVYMSHDSPFKHPSHHVSIIHRSHPNTVTDHMSLEDPTVGTLCILYIL